MKVYIVTAHVPWDSAFRLCLVTSDESQADKYLEEHEPDPEMDDPYNGIKFHFLKTEMQMGVPHVYDF